MGGVLAVHAANLGLVPASRMVLQALPKEVSEYRARRKPGEAPKQ